MKALLSKWQEQDAIPFAAAVTLPENAAATPSEALFYKWEQEDEGLTEAERQAQAEQWRQFQQDINAERAAAGMRRIF